MIRGLTNECVMYNKWEKLIKLILSKRSLRERLITAYKSLHREDKGSAKGFCNLVENE